MKKIRSRESLINFILDSRISRSMHPAKHLGTGVYQGGLSNITPSNHPCVILRCNSPITKKHWNVAVVARDASANYVVRIVPKLPWQWWVGDCGNPQLYRGDRPDKYANLRREIRGILDD